MASHLKGDVKLPPGWDDDFPRQMGQLFVMGFDGTVVDARIRSLIEEHHLGCIILSAKNMKSAEETTKLVLELQMIARNAGHPVPLLIGVDQENGGVNSLYDEIYIRQFPSAMGIAATGSKSLAREVAKATGQELNAVGVNWILGPVLDVLMNARSQPLGVRSIGDDPQEVSAYGVEFIRGYQDAGLAACGKHFPSYGNLDLLVPQSDVPVITDSLEQLSMSALIPYRNAIAQGLDSMMVGGCAMASTDVNALHACLSEQVVDELLRRDLRFDGVVLSECLEMEALSYNIGVGGGTVMAVKAGCDLILVCRSFAVQQEAINGLKLGVENGMISRDRISQSVRRVLDMKSRCTSWEQALNPPGLNLLSKMQPSHTNLSTKSYSNSITVVRDKNNVLPLNSTLEPDEELLLLTPLVRPLPASATSVSMNSQLLLPSPMYATESSMWEHGALVTSGESVFREFGRSLARQRNGRVLHTSYTSNGLRPVHENLINRASAVIVVTADAQRNLYQTGFTKHVSMICNYQFNNEKRPKPLIVVAVSSPFDFATDTSIGTYICTYDFTETALQTLVRILYGELTPKGSLPGTLSSGHKAHSARQHWLVESWNEDRDSRALDELLGAVREDQRSMASPQQLHQRSELQNVTSSTFTLRNCGSDVEEAHFVVRNSSTHALYGFCSTYFFKSTGTGAIGAIIVDPQRRKLSIGTSLHNRAIRTLMQRPGVRRFQLGSRLPGVYPGIPTGSPVDRKRLRQWFAGLGWNTSLARSMCTMVLHQANKWAPPEGLTRSLHHAEIAYELVYGSEKVADSILDHVRSSNSRQGVLETYAMALQGAPESAIIRAKRRENGVVLGSVVVFSSSSVVAEYVPAVRAVPGGLAVGGITAPVISPAVGEYATVVQGLILLGIKQIRGQGAGAVVLDCVDGDGHFDSLAAMGFSVLHSFEEVSCDAATWKVVGAN